MIKTGITDRIRRATDKRKSGSVEKILSEYFEVINGYIPRYSTFEGGLYEMELTRACVHAFAQHVSKLKPEVMGSGNDRIRRALLYKPNAVMDTKKYLYRLATYYECDNNAVIAPIRGEGGDIIGYYPMCVEHIQIVDYNGTKYVRYDFGSGNYAAVEFDKCGYMAQHTYHNEYYGESNAVLFPTINMIHAQNEATIEGAKNSAAIRFIAKLTNAVKDSTIDEERKKFRQSNLGASNNGGAIIIDGKYDEVKQIISKSYTVDDAQARSIKESVFNYFGTNENILQNKFGSNDWAAYYEGKIEPFALEASLVHTAMTFTDHEIAFDNSIMFSSNRLQYATNEEKLSFVTQMFDRGMLTANQGMDVFNMPRIGPEGDIYHIRKEYDNPDANANNHTSGNTDSDTK